jgi:hypothetical protein
VETALALSAVLTALVSSLWFAYRGACTKYLERCAHLARRRTAVVVAVSLLPVVIRLILLPWLPPPEPRVPDEFSHLLVADTLASGHLANPPHPMSRHLETIYVLQHPTYSSIYPIGQGFVLAVGQVFTGHPWAGVLLSVALMSGAITWMLYGSLPAEWAAVGGVLAALQFGLAPLWVSSYWGGAFCAFGGALMLGALLRLRRTPSGIMGATAGIGWSIAWLVRPFESLLPFVVLWMTLAVLVFRERRSWRRWVAPIVLVLSAQLLAGAITLLHNDAVTGSALTLPYQLSQRVYGVPQNFLWRPAVTVPDLEVTELKQLSEWQRKQKEDLDEHPIRGFRVILKDAWRFFVTPWYSLPLLAALFLIRDPEVALSSVLLLCALAVSALYAFFQPHYVAAYTGVVFFLIMRGTMAITTWSVGRVPIGGVLALFLALGGSLTAVPFARMATEATREPRTVRQQVSHQLGALGGRHVVFVRYDATHSFHDEVVYNAADIDAAPIVWCRSMGEVEDAEVARYYTDRRMWLADVTGESVTMSPYEIVPATGTGAGLPAN